jgi:hypothetical protein
VDHLAPNHLAAECLPLLAAIPQGSYYLRSEQPAAFLDEVFLFLS